MIDRDCLAGQAGVADVALPSPEIAFSDPLACSAIASSLPFASFSSCFAELAFESMSLCVVTNILFAPFADRFSVAIVITLDLEFVFFRVLLVPFRALLSQLNLVADIEPPPRCLHYVWVCYVPLARVNPAARSTICRSAVLAKFLGRKLRQWLYRIAPVARLFGYSNFSQDVNLLRLGFVLVRPVQALQRLVGSLCILPREVLPCRH